MNKNPLHIVSGTAESSLPRRGQGFGRNTVQERTDAIRARFERLWLLTPEIFNPNRSAIERTRIARTWEILQALLTDSPAIAADLGFGWGALTRQLAKASVTVDAVDAATQALKHFETEPLPSVKLIRGVIPNTELPDQHYDLVICTELIADLHSHDQRLLISEMYRVVKPNGRVVLSTGLDIDTEGALEQLSKLIETELTIERWTLSYHVYYLRLLRLLRTPERYVRAKNEVAFRDKELAKRSGVSANWLKLQCVQPFHFLWKCVSGISGPLANHIEQSHRALHWMESVCRTLKTEDGVSHAICIAKRKPLQETAETAESTMSRPNQRLRERVWE